MEFICVFVTHPASCCQFNYGRANIRGLGCKRTFGLQSMRSGLRLVFNACVGAGRTHCGNSICIAVIQCVSQHAQCVTCISMRMTSESRFRTAVRKNVSAYITQLAPVHVPTVPPHRRKIVTQTFIINTLSGEFANRIQRCKNQGSQIC